VATARGIANASTWNTGRIARDTRPASSTIASPQMIVAIIVCPEG